MCKFFSMLSNGRGKYLYCSAEHRKELIANGESPDSHTTIFKYFRDKGEVSQAQGAEDLFNKYEYNPITKEFTVDSLSDKAPNDSAEVEIFCKSLDFSVIVPELRIREIVYPLLINRKSAKVTKKEIQLLKKWDSVWGSMRDSVWGSVCDSVGDSVWDSVWDSVGDSVWDSMRDSVWGSMRDSVWGSMRDSIYSHISEFFALEEWQYIKHKKGENPFQSGIDLWHRGLIPNFDGKTWRLHAGKDAKIVFEITKEELNKIN